MPGLKTRAYTGFLVLSLLLSLVNGCATGREERAVVVPEPSVGKKIPQGPAVERLTGGQEGFVITEISPMSEASRRDFNRAVELLRDESYDEAIALLEKIVEESPGVTAPYIDIAIAYRHTGRPERAEENLMTALELFPGHPVVCNEFGLLYRGAGRFAEARGMYESAIARFPDYYPAHRNLGILCDLYLNDLACALEHYEVYSEAKPGDEQVKLWVADLRARLGRD